MPVRRTHAGDVAPPIEPPVSGDGGDEGPMRRELLRQIAELDTRLAATTAGWTRAGVTPERGPALLPTSSLEAIRGELLAALRR